VLKLRQARIVVVWEADTAQHTGCQRALSNCLAELTEAQADTDVAQENYQAACRDVADAWGRQIAAEAERDVLRVELDEYRDWEQSTLGKALLKIANTDEAFVELRKERDKLQAELDALKQRRCETCRSFHAGTYDCLTECTPLRCVVNDYSEWDARE